MHIFSQRKMSVSPVAVLALSLALPGCAAVDSGRVVRPGDEVAVHFACSLPDGQLVSSTRKSMAYDTSRVKASIFIPSSNDEPLTLPTGEELADLRKKSSRAMEDEIANQLVDDVVGMRQGETRIMKLVAAKAVATEGNTHVLQMPRVRHRPKQVTFSVQEFKSRKGGDPAVGQAFTIDPAFPGKVVKVDGNEVVIDFAPRSGSTKTPFGIGTIKTTEKGYEVDIDAEKGRLVRTGALVGVISDANDKNFSVDYSNPFGGMELTCEVQVASVKEGKSSAVAAPAPVKAATAGSEPGKAPPVGKSTSGAAAYESAPVAKGDLVRVTYTASLEDGEIVATDAETIANDTSRTKVDWFAKPAAWGPEELMAGKPEVFPGLGTAVVGMRQGEKKHVVLSPEQAFGPADPKKQSKFPCARTMPRVLTMSAEEYVKRFSGFPAINKEVQLVPFFKSRVKEVTDRYVTLENLAKDGETVQDAAGTVTVSVNGDQITTVLKPKMGAMVPVEGGMGFVTESDGTTFTVDGNNPLAGKRIVLDLEVASVTKIASLHNEPISWVEDYDRALALSKEEKRPTFLILYADWCGWCKKTLTEVLPDPRLAEFAGKFVWAKVNSDKETKYKELYHQDGFPLMLVLSPDGTVKRRINGYHDVLGLKSELEAVL